jgi:hypothetical protein
LSRDHAVEGGYDEKRYRPRVERIHRGVEGDCLVLLFTCPGGGQRCEVGGRSDVAVFEFREQADFCIATEASLISRADEREPFRALGQFIDKFPVILSSDGEVPIEFRA